MSGAGWVRDNQRGQCDYLMSFNGSTSWPGLSISASPLRVTRTRQGAPSTSLETKPKVSSTCLRHVGIAAWPWSCKVGFPLWENPLVLSHHCRGLMYSRPKVITFDAADIRPSSFLKPLDSEWPTFSYSWLTWGLTRPEQGHCVPASWSDPTPRPDKRGNPYWRNTLSWH